jgi:hypothetical protein
MTKKTSAAVSISTTNVTAHGVGGVATGVTHGVTSSVEGRRCCSQCDLWKSLQSFDSWSRICRVCKAEALR